MMMVMLTATHSPARVLVLDYVGPATAVCRDPVAAGLGFRLEPGKAENAQAASPRAQEPTLR